MRILATNGSPSTRVYFLLKLIIVPQQTKCEESVYGKVVFLSSSSLITKWGVILEGVSLILANLVTFFELNPPFSFKVHMFNGAHQFANHKKIEIHQNLVPTIQY